uniref:Reverse transcriptase domain-containing protein n=1 Tax=Cannabis sativa TaxID=3483 RepID=A0A803P4A6_CANSA
MVKKKRVGRKPAIPATEVKITGEDVPLSQIEGIEPELSEEFHDSIEELAPENGTERGDLEQNVREMQQAVPTPSSKHSYTKPMRVGDQIVAKLDLEEIEVEASFWKNAIVCFVLGANPPFRVFEGFVKRIWGNLGIDKVVRMHSGCTLVNFRDEATRDLILAAGVIHFDRKLVVLRPWSTEIDAMKMVNSVPVWIRLNGLGLHYWGKKNLSALVSTIGKPIMIDKVTQERSMVKFARVLVDIEISDEPPKTISFINEKKQPVEQTIEYEWLPTTCVACAGLGHTVVNCNKEKKVVWKKKSVAEKTAPKEQGNDHGDTGNTSEKNLEAAQLEKEDQKENKEGNMDNVEASSKWLTPKKKAVRNTEVKMAKEVPKEVNSSNGYAVLQATESDEIMDKYVNVEVLYESSQLVHCKVKVCGQKKGFLVTAVYGYNKIEDRKNLWDSLASLGSPNEPWVIVGDFNAMFAYQDRWGGRPIQNRDIVDAQDWLALGQIEEFKCSGSFYTWTNKHEIGDKIFSKLDRVFVNNIWLSDFPNSEACFKWEVTSDHCYCLIRSQVCNNVGIKPFRFGNHWPTYNGFEQRVMESWNKKVSGKGLDSLMQKLHRVKHVLKVFSRHEVGDVALDYKSAKEMYCNDQEIAASNPTNSLLQQLVKEKHLAYMTAKERLAQVRIMRKRRLENRITTFTKGNTVVDDFEEVVNHFVKHFETFMGSKSSASNIIDESCIKLGNCLNLEQQVKLIRPFTKDDVKKALFSIHTTKSPGLDGFGSGFYKSLWSNIGDDVSTAVPDFFASGRLPKDLNVTVISLIPKVINPSSAKDYRPIACCNTVYKCISKMICSRLSEVLPTLVDSNQGAFIKDRSLAHNIMIFQDLLKGMLCFPSRFISWIMTCLKGTNYHILLNGRIQGSFKGKKGLRQGDLMSPLLFVMIMDYLTRLLRLYSNEKGFGFHPLCKTLCLINLCFADDLIIFCKGNLNSIRLTHDAFVKFWNDTGLSANTSKSHIYFGGVKEEIKSKILECVKIEEGGFPLKYLGINLRPTKWKAEDCGVILDKLNKNLNCWASRNLSFAAIDKSCRDFLWGSSGNRSKLHRASWEKVCLPKNLGGIGFREGKKWNKALLAKNLWALASKQDCLWVKWINLIYLRTQDIWSYTTKYDDCWYFKKILNIRDNMDEARLCQAVKGGKFSAKRFYNLSIEVAKAEYAKASWDKLIVPKHRFVFWQILNSQLLTRDYLGRFLSIQNVHCPVCEAEVETHEHLFFNCKFTKQVIDAVMEWLGCFSWPRTNLELLNWCKNLNQQPQMRVLNIVIAATMYSIWKNRNSCVFYLCCAAPRRVSLDVRKTVQLRLLGKGPFEDCRKNMYFLNVIKSW